MAIAVEEGVRGWRVWRKVVRWVRSLVVSLLVLVVVDDGISRRLQMRTINGTNGA